MMLAAALGLALQATPSLPPLQVLESPAFETLLRDVHARCRASQVRYASPAALLDAEDDFVQRLAPKDLARLHRAVPQSPQGGPARCADRDGAACPAAAMLDGVVQTGLTDRFTQTICARGDASWN